MPDAIRKLQFALTKIKQSSEIKEPLLSRRLIIMPLHVDQ